MQGLFLFILYHSTRDGHRDAQDDDDAPVYDACDDARDDASAPS